MCFGVFTELNIMVWRIEVREKIGVFDAIGGSIHKNILDLGFISVKDVGISLVYTIEGSLSEDDVKKIGEQLLADRVMQDFSFSEGSAPHYDHFNSDEHIVEIAYNPGVMDPVEASTLKGIKDLGIAGAVSVRTAKQYHIKGKLSEDETRS